MENIFKMDYPTDDVMLKTLRETEGFTVLEETEITFLVMDDFEDTSRDIVYNKIERFDCDDMLQVKTDIVEKVKCKAFLESLSRILLIKWLPHTRDFSRE